MHARNHEYLHASRVTTPRVWTGLLLNEMYKVGSLIEQGATTELYDGTEVSTGEPVALKILLPQLADDAKTRTLFLDEARVLTRLSQPGLHRYRSCARDPQSELTYIVTDVVGARLSSRLGARKLSQQDILDLTKRLALALGAAHRAGLVHRNLRPHAIALPEGRLAEAVVTDFNLIKTAHSGRNPAFDDAMLDHAFCAPEQLSKNREGAVVGPWTDIYSLALVVLAAMGAKPSESDAAPDLSLLPRKLRPVFERMLEPRPARRLQSMDDVVRQLDLTLGSAPLRSLLNRAPSLRLPRFRRSEIQEPKAKAVQPAVAPKPATTPKPIAAAPAKPLLAPSAPARKPLPPLPDSLLPAKKVPLGKFHEARSPMGPGGIARRAAVALTALLLAASPWIIQTSLPRGPAEASTVAPAPVQSAKAQAESRYSQAARAFAALPKGQVYGSDNTYSRVTLRVHRPTRVTVHARGTRLLFSRLLQPGDSYRAPTLADLTLTAEDSGAVEVVYNGTPVGFVGRNSVPIERLPLNRFASLAPPSAGSEADKRGKASPGPAIATTTTAPALTPEQAEAVARGIAAIEQEASQTGSAPATDQADAPTVATDAEAAPNFVEQAAGEEPATEPPVALQEPAKPAVVLPAPPAPSARPVAVVNTPAPGALLRQVIVAPPAPVTEPEGRRPFLERLLPWRADRETAPAPAAQPNTAAAALILAPAITKDAADRAKTAADMAKTAREAAQAKAARENRAREGAFFNSTLGINSRF